jgi:hypothetical protein
MWDNTTTAFWICWGLIFACALNRDRHMSKKYGEPPSAGWWFGFVLALVPIWPMIVAIRADKVDRSKLTLNQMAKYEESVGQRPSLRQLCLVYSVTFAGLFIYEISAPRRW